MTQIINDMNADNTITFGSVVAIGNFDGVHIGQNVILNGGVFSDIIAVYVRSTDHQVGS